MGTKANLRDGDRRLARRMIARGPSWVRRFAPVVQEAAEHTKVWWTAAGMMAACGGWRGRTAAVAGSVAMTTAELLSNAVAKQLYQRRRPPAGMGPAERSSRPPGQFLLPFRAHGRGLHRCRRAGVASRRCRLRGVGSDGGGGAGAQRCTLPLRRGRRRRARTGRGRPGTDGTASAAQTCALTGGDASLRGTRGPRSERGG